MMSEEDAHLWIARVGHLWLINPSDKTLDVLRLESAKWVVAGLYSENDKVLAEPFLEVEIDLANLRME